MAEYSEKSKFCAHCSSTLSLKTWRTHKRLFYDDASETWIKKVQIGEEFDHWDEDSHLSLAFDVSSRNEFESEEIDRSEIPPQVDFDVEEEIFYDALSEQAPSGRFNIRPCYYVAMYTSPLP